MANYLSRRTFLKATAAAPLILAGRAGSQPAPSEQITLGFIGTGGHGVGWNLKYFSQIPEVRVLAVCDVFQDRRESAKARVDAHHGNADCAMYNDFRELLARDDVDAVVISTPDHWHVLMSVMAARAGKDVFCEKPTLTIEEGQALVRVFRETGRIFQGGIEDRSVAVYHRMAELVRNGALGKLERIRVALPPGDAFPKEESAPVPEGLDYDLWLGPAPYAPYSPTRLEPQQWRNIFDYSGGKFTDWGAHLMDTAQVALFEEHGGPVEVEGVGDFPVDCMADAATTYELNYRYANGVTMEVKSDGAGIGFYGSEGWIRSNGWRAAMESSSEEIAQHVFPPDANKMYPLPPGEHQAFIDGVKSRAMPYYSPADIHRLSSAMHIGNIAMRLGRKLQWDPAAEEFPGDAEANAMRGRPMRAPWTLDA
ncbi:MAG: Gfo/Idh/MocA family oxidoreductase [Candidatus Hydrogenedentes bacterium]|nr:Gfo/Idh/MocA family oxidoreductase [Candidatus Hydrogenedentota bacterium]